MAEATGIQFYSDGATNLPADTAGLSAEAPNGAETADPVPAKNSATDGKSRYEARRPGPLQFFIEPRYNFFNNMVGIPAGVQTVSAHDDGNGLYTFGIGGPVTTWNSGELRMGLTWLPYDKVNVPDRPDVVKYRGWGYPLTVSASFGQHHVTRYSALTTFSTEQLQQMGYQFSEDVSDSVIDAFYNADTSELMNIADAFDLLVSGYDPSEDVGLSPYQEDIVMPYYRIGIEQAVASKDDFDASHRVSFRGNGRLSAGVYVMGYGGNQFLGFGPTLEVTPIQFSHRTVRAEVVLNLGANYYMRMDPKSLFHPDQGEFLTPQNFLLQGFSGIGIRVSTNVPKPKAVYAVGRTAVEKSVEVAKEMDEHPVDMGEIPPL